MKIRLHMNEMPYPPPEEIIKEEQKGLTLLNRYASPEDLDLIQKTLANYSNVPKKHIITFPGSDFILREVVHIFSKNRKVIMVYPTFFITYDAAKQFSQKFVEIPLEPPDFDLNVELLLKEINEPCLIIIDNPNNPTGKIILDKRLVKTLLENENVLLLIDEAYYEFTDISFADMVINHPNLAVGRTISKAFGLAGVRIGYIIAGVFFLEAFSSYYVILPQTSLFATVKAVENPEYMKQNVKRIIAERERVKKELEKMELQVYPSTTNFLLIKTHITNIGEKLYEKGIMVLDLSNRWRSGFFRVAIGTKENNDTFLSKLDVILKDFNSFK